MTTYRLFEKLLRNEKIFKNVKCNFSSSSYRRSVPRSDLKHLLLVGSGICAYTCYNFYLKNHTVHALNVKKMKEDDKAVKLTARERRFIKFSSVEFDGQLYMTPQDFLESVVEQEPRPRLKRRNLTLNEINKIKDATPSLKKGSPTMFRDLRDKGIISYTEYLFLLSILTKPQSGFRIAFNMFDTDGNQRVDKNEFLVIRKIIGGSLSEQSNLDSQSKEILLRLISTSEQATFLKKEGPVQSQPNFMEKIFSGAWKDKRGQRSEDSEESDELIDDSEGLQRRHKVDTTIQVHLFGKKGDQDLKYEGFYKFMDNLQNEVLELEFSEFSKGNPAITEVDFAKILLRYTYLDTDEYDMFLERLLDRVKDEKGISFVEFRDFCRFLNNLDDFAIAMRMYTLADRAISKDEFSRAVKICTGYTLTTHLIDTVFAIFDEDGDGLLSYKEFIAIMRDRLHRGFKSVAKSEGWDAFKHCVKQEMKPKS
ncbi:MICU3 family protein [Megaselia abdita]